MKDIHSHLIPGIDDGSRTIEESIMLLKKMEQQGITDLVLTPHYVEKSRYVCNNKEKRKKFDELKNEAEKNNININLYLGNEVFFTPHIKEYIENDEVETINGSKYILIEFPMTQVYRNTHEIIQELITNEYVPILAHPERYKIFQSHPDLIEEYLRKGILLQGNATSLLGKYGKEAKKTLKYFIKKGYISFLGTDTHRDFKFNEKKLIRIIKKLNKNEEYVNNMLYKNFEKVINNEYIAMIR